MLNERVMPNPRRKWRFRYLPAFRNQSLYPYPESGCLSSLRCFTLRKCPWGCWTVLRNSPVTGRALRTCSPASSAPGDADSCSSHGSTSWASTITSAWQPPPLLALFQGVVGVPAALEELLPAPRWRGCSQSERGGKTAALEAVAGWDVRCATTISVSPWLPCPVAVCKPRYPRRGVEMPEFWVTFRTRQRMRKGI